MTVITKEIAKQNLASNLKRILKDRGLSLSELSRRTGDHVMVLSDCSRAKSMPAGDVIARIAKALDVSMDRLLEDPPEFVQKLH